MALIVETGTGADPTANSYASRAEIIAYAAQRGVTLPDDDTTDVLAILAMDYLRMESWRGRPLIVGNPVSDPIVIAQPLDFPRVLDPFQYGGAAIPGFVPEEIKLAQMQLCIEQKNGLKLLPTNGGSSSAQGKFLVSQKLGPIERSYSEAAYLASSLRPTLPFIDALLSRYVKARGPTVAVRR